MGNLVFGCINIGIGVRCIGGDHIMLNDNYFSTIDDETKAYFVGYLLADGCITKHHGVYRQIQLHLSSSDIKIVEKLKEVTESNRKIYISPNGERCMFRDSSDIMVSDLSKFGIVPCKTGNEQPDFSSIPGHLLNHAIRGLIDGDGWISIGQSCSGKRIISLGICGSKYTCEYVTHILSEKTGVSMLSASKVKDKDCYKLGYTNINDVKNIIRYLYNNATIGLTRKYNNAYKIMNMQ